MEVSSGFSLAEIFKAVITGLVIFLVWLLRKFGETHIETIKSLTVEVRGLREDVQTLSNRITKVETWVDVHNSREE